MITSQAESFSWLLDSQLLFCTGGAPEPKGMLNFWSQCSAAQGFENSGSSSWASRDLGE